MSTESNQPFLGDFEMLPIRVSLTLSPVPAYPTDEEFQTAACATTRPECGTMDHACARWRLEAIRERRLRPGAAFDADTLNAIAQRVAKSLFTEARGQ